MLTEYIKTALDRAEYELIDDEEPYFGKVPDLEGVWATGVTLERCRSELSAAIEDWLLFSLARGLSIPPLGGLEIRVPERVAS